MWKVEPTATYEEVAHFVRAKETVAMKMDNPPGFLLKAVPRCFEGVPFAAYRRGVRAWAEAVEQEQRRREAEMHQIEHEQHAILQDPNASQEDKQFARMYLGTAAADETG
ncbi:MAG: hypothetical protein LAQ69_47435 [Acidobacteriia bacterium]|nr:hypothetical protein [Terriglobia bacterium]